MINDKLIFLSNKVKKNQDSEKSLNLFENFRKLSTPARFLFLQETHS